MGDEVGTRELSDLPADSRDHGAQAQVAGGHLCCSEHAEGEHEQGDVGERSEHDRAHSQPARHRGAERARPGRQARQPGSDQHADPEHDYQQQAAQA